MRRLLALITVAGLLNTNPSPVLATNDCLQIQFSLPPCATGEPVELNGSAQSCSTNMLQLTYAVDGKAPVTLCTNCGPLTNFPFTVPTLRSFPLTINEPAAIAGQYQNTADVGWAPVGVGVTGEVVYVGQGCPGDAYLVPETSVAGKIVLIDRGGCAVTLKVDRAAKLGASGVLLGLTAPGDAATFGYGGGDTFIPTLVITKDVADQIKTHLGEPVSVTLAEGSGSTIAVTASDDQGNVVTVQPVPDYDFIPPTIETPGNIMFTTSSSEAIVDFTVTGTDNRPEPITIVCLPPSGSTFPVGTTPITCSATDACGNSNTVSFDVIVRPPTCPLQIELTTISPPLVTLTWDCDGRLQSAPAVAGPWADVTGATSPFASIAEGEPTFYRLNAAPTNTALQFPGVTGVFASVTNHQAELNFFPLTITAWVKTVQNAPVVSGLISKYNDASLNGYSIFLFNGRVRAWYFRDGSNYIWDGGLGLDGGFVADDQWHHLALVVDGTGGSVYLDGGSVTNRLWTGTGGVCRSPASLQFGQYHNYTSNYQGQMEEVTLWNTALAASQITDLITVTPAGNEPGLQGHWRFDEAGGRTAFDQTGHAHNAGLAPGMSWVNSTAPIFH